MNPPQEPPNKGNTMNRFGVFLAGHAKHLEEVNDRATLSNWHRRFAHAWARDATALASSANDHLDLKDDQAIQPDVGYLAVERRLDPPDSAQPWVLLSANPGWNETSNALERVAKGQREFDAPVDIEAYERFRTTFFDSWFAEVMHASGRARGAGWWNNACRFLHEVSGLEKPAGMMSLHPSFDAIGWELWPFHSTRDGLTGKLADDRHGIRSFATASLQAALRMAGTRGVIAASSAAGDVAAALTSTYATHFVEMNRGHLKIAYQRRNGSPHSVGVELTRYRYLPTDRELIVIRRQIFSNYGTPPTELRSAIVEAIQRGLPFESAAQELGTRKDASSSSRARTLAKPEPQQAQCVTFSDVSRDSPLVVSVPVKETAFLSAPDLEDEDEMQLRTVGYWQARPDGPVVSKIRDALVSGRRAFVMARASGRVLRLYEILPGCEAEPPKSFVYKDNAAFLLESAQPDTLRTADGLLFASAYVHGNATRLRFHAVECMDDSLRGAPIDSDVAMLNSPRLCAFSDLCDPRVRALLDTRRVARAR
jgi:hypothetical protein